MNDLATLLIIVGVVLVAGVGWLVSRSRRRARTVSQPFPTEWRALLEKSLPLYRRMPPELRLRLEPLVRGFLNDVRFVGCNGLAITDEMRLIVAVQACVLIVGHDENAYRDLMSVLIYPDEFVVNRTNEDEAGVVTEFEDVLAGESIDTARIVLSWRDVTEPLAEGEICNVVLHEFAHYLDNSIAGNLADVIPEGEYDAHCDAIEQDEETLVNPEGAENPAEFVAYATEVFFEAPAEMRRRHPALYDGLKSAYRLDPAAWPANALPSHA